MFGSINRQMVKNQKNLLNYIGKIEFLLV